MIWNDFNTNAVKVSGISFHLIISIGYHNQGAGGSMNGLLLLHLGYGQEWFQNGLIEELLLHEASHACLDEHHKYVRKFEESNTKWIKFIKIYTYRVCPIPWSLSFIENRMEESSSCW